MGRSLEELNQSFDAFLAKEKGLESKEGDTAVATAENVLKTEAPRKLSTPNFKEADFVDQKHVERAMENSKNREINFGAINKSAYGAAFDKWQQVVSRSKDLAITKANQKVYYTEIVEKAVKESQVYKSDGSPENPEALMLKVLADRIRRKYNEYAGNKPISISCYSAIGSDLEKDKGVVAVVEMSTPENNEKFYITTQGYERDTRFQGDPEKDKPLPSRFFDDLQHLGVPGVSVPVPFGGFDDKDTQMAFKNTLPKRIGDDAAGKMISKFREVPGGF
jgi:hypothetical protein